jgi:hypothetical protein
MLKSSPPKPERNRVDFSTKESVRHWCKHFGRSKDEIEAAIAKVGDNAESVAKELGRTAPLIGTGSRAKS